MTTPLPKVTPKSKQGHPHLHWHQGKYVPALVFSPTAWAKLVFFCHQGETEIGGFGITLPEDPLCIEEFMTVKQETSSVTVAFDDEAVAEYFDDQVDCERRPEEFARIWLHTHPGDSPHPSQTDEETFERVFGPCDWAVMFILSRTGKTYARLRFNVGPKGDLEIPVNIDYRMPFLGSEHAEWLEEFKLNIHPELSVFDISSPSGLPSSSPASLLVQSVVGCAPYQPRTLSQPVFNQHPEKPFGADGTERELGWDADWWDYFDNENPL